MKAAVTSSVSVDTENLIKMESTSAEFPMGRFRSKVIALIEMEGVLPTDSEPVEVSAEMLKRLKLEGSRLAGCRSLSMKCIPITVEY